MEVLVILVAVIVVGFLGHAFFKRTYLAGEQAVALSQYSAQFVLYDAVRLHDWMLCSLVDMHTHPWGRANLSEADYYNFHLESVVALRDRLDELLGKDFGTGNKVRIRMKLALATSSLSKQTHHEDRFQLITDFKFGEGFPSDGVKWLGLHMEMMERIFLHPGKVHHIQGLESRFRS